MQALAGLKVVTAQEMARIEALAIAHTSQELFMQNAASAIADAVEQIVQVRDLEKVATLLIGKGNNGGDAYASGTKLRGLGFAVHAMHLGSLEECSPLCRLEHERFKQAGGRVECVRTKEELQFPSEGVILDGLVGTGFHGRAEGLLAGAIERANAAQLPIVSIDIPSGLNGNTGRVESLAIEADTTIFLELPKVGFFLASGWNHVGELVRGAFGLDATYIEQAQPVAYLLDEQGAGAMLPKIRRNRHKYDAGYLLAVAGSELMPGAALLACSAALRSGAGVVRLFHPIDAAPLLCSAPFELIKEPWDGRDVRRVCEEAKRASALCVGPGLGRDKRVQKMLRTLLSRVTLPSVLDADALHFLALHPEWPLHPNAILTPHRREMERLLQTERLDDPTLHRLCQEYVEKRRVTCVLKGAPTFLFHPQSKPLIVTRGDPGMATAGCGDVLTGVIAALLAQGCAAQVAAALGVFLHAAAGEAAAARKGSYSLIASDLIEHLPEAFRRAMRSTDSTTLQIGACPRQAV